MTTQSHQASALAEGEETHFSPWRVSESSSAKLFRHLLRLRTTELPQSLLAKSAIVFSPHPDDECLGCGGLILRKKLAGAVVKLVHMTDGSGSHAHLMSKEELRRTRRQEAEHAAELLGVDDAVYLDFEDSALPNHIEGATKRVLEILQREQPSEVFVPSRYEPARQASDHLATTAIVYRALRLYGDQVTVWEYPVWYWLHWPWVKFRQTSCPGIKTRHVARNSLKLWGGLQAFQEFQYSLNIADVLDRKLCALAAHRSQMTELLPGLQWTTLEQVSNGQFLTCFRQDHEFFRLSVDGASLGTEVAKSISRPTPQP